MMFCRCRYISNRLRTSVALHLSSIENVSSTAWNSGDEGALSKGSWWGWGVGCRGLFSPPMEGSGTGLPPLQKKDFCHLKWRILAYYERYLLSVPLSEKCWIFRSKWWFGPYWWTVIFQYWKSFKFKFTLLEYHCWWTLKTHFVNVMQAIWFLKFWNVTKSGVQFA